MDAIACAFVARDGRYVCADAWLGGELLANRRRREAWAVFVPEPIDAAHVRLRGHADRYVVSRPGAERSLSATATRSAEALAFRILSHGAGAVSLAAGDGWVTVDPARRARLFLQPDTAGDGAQGGRGAPGPWAHFGVVSLTAGEARRGAEHGTETPRGSGASSREGMAGASGTSDGARAGAGAEPRGDGGSAWSLPIATTDDPYELLACRVTDGMAEIQSAYRRRIKQFHPDRLAALDLAPELLAFAEAMTRRLHDAYERLRRTHRRDP